MGNIEWALILFTVLGEAAVGLLLSLWWFDRQQLDSQLFKKATLTSGVILIGAMLVSLFHLGHPEAAYRAITHLSTSWLSREILFFVLTFIAWITLYLQAGGSNGNRRLAAGMAGILGLAGVVSSAMIYVLPRVPAWNNAAPLLFFLLTTGLLGNIILLLLGKTLLSSSQVNTILRVILSFTAGSLIIFILYLSLLAGGSSPGAATGQVLISNPLFWLRAALGWLVPLLLLYPVLTSNKTLSSNLLMTLALTISAAELLGRILFYSSAVGIHITALF